MIDELESGFFSRCDFECRNACPIEIEPIDTRIKTNRLAQKNFEHTFMRDDHNFGHNDPAPSAKKKS